MSQSMHGWELEGGDRRRSGKTGFVCGAMRKRFREVLVPFNGREPPLVAVMKDCAGELVTAAAIV